MGRNNKYLKKLIKRLNSKKNILPFKGCSSEQIDRLNLPEEMPDAYLNFLQVMGESGGGFMEGSSCFIDELSSLNDWATELLEEDEFLKILPKNAFVFWMHQGYQFAFFNLDEGDDPPVYFYYEGRTKVDFELVSKSFSSFLYSQSKFC